MPYTDNLAHFYDLSTPIALPDLGIPGGNPGTGANIASNPVGIHGKSVCAEFNGNNSNYNLGDIAELNEASAFTIAFWMRQDVLDVTDAIFVKGGYGQAETGIVIGPAVTGEMFWQIDGFNQRGWFDYSTVVNAGQWHHLVGVFNGAGIGNIGRLQVYVDASPVVLTYIGTIPANTDDLSGIDATIGKTTVAFDGLLDAFAIFSRPLTQLQVTDHMLATRQGRL